MNHRNHTLIITALALGAIGAALVFAGPLNPPAGPIAPTYKTLSEVEPRIAVNAANTPGDADSVYKITQPGSYYLTGNLQGQASKLGIEIAASHVTLDLMGCTVSGVGAATDGIHAGAGTRAIIVRNGTIQSWGGDGVDFITASEAVLEDVVIEACQASGAILGPSNVARRCTSSRNRDEGIYALGAACRVADCTASFNYGHGIRTLGAGAIVSNCIVYSNLDDGILINGGAIVEGNNCTANGDTSGSNVGIHVYGKGSRISGNVMNHNGFGLYMQDDGNLPAGNLSSLNGIDYYFNGLVTGWTAIRSTETTFDNAEPWDNFK